MTKDIHRTKLYRKTVALVSLDKRRYKRELRIADIPGRNASEGGRVVLFWEGTIMNGVHWGGSPQGSEFWLERYKEAHA